MAKDVEHTKICDALYQSSITNEPHAQRSYIILWILCLIGTFIVLFFWLWIRRRDKQFASGHVDEANKSFLYIYKFLIYIYISLVGMQTMLMTLEVTLIEAFAIPYNNFFISLIQSLILTIPNFQMALIAFLYTKNTLSSKALFRSLKFAIPYALTTFVTSMLDERSWLNSSASDNDSSQISTSAVLRVANDLIFECFCLLIVCRQCQYSWKRKNIILRYLVFVMLIIGFDFIAQIFQSGQSDGNCFQQIGFYAWYILYPFVFFQTIRSDSSYHWSYASKPLIESTQQSIADLDLFSLPGYHGVHFESIEDQKFRFKKLKQLVSGYVPIIPFHKIKLTDSQSNTIGTGSTSKVFRGSYKSQPVAIKCLTRLDKKNKDQNASWNDLTLIFRESILSSSLSHPNVVRFLGASLTYNGFFLVYEYCVYGDLQQILVENSFSAQPQLSTISQRLFYLLDIAEGMQFLHKSGFVHRDLKTANVVVTYSQKNRRFVAKICDFGVSRKLPDEQQEVMNKNQHSFDRFNKSISAFSDVPNSFSSRSSLFYTPPSASTASNVSIQINSKSDNLPIPSSQNMNMSNNEHNGQWQKFANRGNTREIMRTIHVGTPAFLAPEILLKLVKSKGVDLEKESKKLQKKQQKKKQKEEKEEGKEEEHNHYVRGAILDHIVDPHIYCGYATDVYSFGMILWSVVTSKLPYKGFKPIKMILMIKNSERLNVSDKEWKKWKDCKDLDIDVSKLQDLLEQCWAQYPYQRPSFEQIGFVLQAIIQDSHRNFDSMPQIVAYPESFASNFFHSSG